MAEEWTTETTETAEWVTPELRVLVGDEVKKTYQLPVRLTSEDIIEVARESGIRRFTVEIVNRSGERRALAPEDFPLDFHEPVDIVILPKDVAF